MDRLKDDVPEVAAATLKVLEVSEVVNGRSMVKAAAAGPPTGCRAPYRPVGLLLTVCSVVSGVV